MIRKLLYNEIEEAISLQNRIYDNLIDKDLYIMTTPNDFYDIFEKDYLLGYFINDKLVGVLTIITNRLYEQNLCFDCNLDYKDCYTFDAVYVDNEYRGKGIQNKLLEYGISIAEEKNIKYILSTVSPNNVYSHHNFELNNFIVYKQMIKYEKYLSRSKKILIIRSEHNEPKRFSILERNRF